MTDPVTLWWNAMVLALVVTGVVAALLSQRASRRAKPMIAVPIWISVILALVIVLVVAYHLIGVFLALRRAGDHLQALAGGLVKVRDDTAPPNRRVDQINAGLSAVPPWSRPIRWVRR